MLFADLSLHPQILKTVAAEGYATATPIQAQAVPHVLAGRDVLGCAQTGTGKTAAFAMPILHRLAADASANRRKPRCLVLCPTRELAVQIAESFTTYGRGLNLRLVTVFGGVSQFRQVDTLQRGVDIVVATPGRLEDLMDQRVIDLGGVNTLVLDEADRMLDMGFIMPIRRISKALSTQRQTLLFSATMLPEIRKLADSLLKNPAVINVTPANATAPKIEERAYRVDSKDKPALLAHLVKDLPMYRTIVFTRTKHGADRVVRDLHKRGIKSEAIHGNKSQNARQRALANFTADRIPVLVATDIASRGIDVDGITHVVNYDLTHEPETYVHRIGRTARAGASGMAISFCSREESSNLRAIERLIRRPIEQLINPLPPAVPNGASPLVAEIHETAHREARGLPRGEPREGGSNNRPRNTPNFRNTGGHGGKPKNRDNNAPRNEGGDRRPSEHAPRAVQSRGGHAPRAGDGTTARPRNGGHPLHKTGGGARPNQGGNRNGRR